jgi:hypothetical protein
MKKNRRRAVHAELIRESKDNPGYFRYNITIREKDGMEHVVPAYGKDMQDAIERLLWNERVDKVTKPKFVIASFAGLLLGVVALSGMLGVIYNNTLLMFGGLGVCGVTLSLTSIISSYLNKK